MGASAVAAGMDFTVWLCNGRLWSAGNPQFGQLGHGTDHEYNASDCAHLNLSIHSASCVCPLCTATVLQPHGEHTPPMDCDPLV